MKKNIVFALVVFLFVGLCVSADAQTKKKKKKSKSTTTAVAADTAAAPPPVTAAPPPPPAAGPTPPDGILDTGHTDYLVADSSTFNYVDNPLDSVRPVDGMYKIPLLRGAKPYAFPKVSKYDIKFYKRVWRQIDLTDSVNSIFHVPDATLMGILMDALKSEKLVAYKDESYRKRLTYQQVLKSLNDSVSVPDLDTLTGELIGTHKIFVPFNPDSVLRFEIKEDIFLDKTRGRVVTEIVGLAPIRRVKGSTGEVIGEDHPFYLYFPQCRNIFAGRDIFDTERDIYNVSFDDIFISRNFKTQIVKVSNPADLRIKDKYPDEERQKKESDRIEKEIQKYKKDVWKY